MGSAGVVTIYYGDGSDDSDAVLEFDAAVEEGGKGSMATFDRPNKVPDDERQA